LEFSLLKNGNEYSVEFETENKELIKYAEKLEYELNGYPERCMEKINK